MVEGGRRAQTDPRASKRGARAGRPGTGWWRYWLVLWYMHISW